MTRAKILTGFLVACLCAVAVSPADAARRKKKETEENKPAEVQKYEKQFPTGATWALREMNGKPVGGEAPTLKIDENLRGTGFSGCNTFSATLYPIKGQKLAMGPIAQTKKMCPTPVMVQERNYLIMLISGPDWDLVGADLVVKGKAGSLRFQRAAF